ncbi:putative protein yfdR [Fibrella aestuarina BUZ 2]|uniref:Metal dependent phosphohydrolase n=1 Tax=Fibrella aestuarina BUZ 2 TaxID=1166018 RepID=I0KD42_9BACT|nr:hypothetical protein [Fibrella aestuarina]CCH02045.1 putative protein yfdR [Fibrella aestuarina BUZ 2]
MNETTRTGPYIQTYTGKRYYPIDPRPDDIDIEDIAHALSNICRFTGHTRQFYSVAQHSVLVSRQVDPEHKLAALLHDASEAYLTDLSRPVKRIPALMYYEHLETLAMTAIAQKLGFTYPVHPSIKVADERMLFTEKRDLLTPMDWGYEVEPYPDIVDPWSPDEAEGAFLGYFLHLCKYSCS